MENLVVFHNGQPFYVPLVSPTDANASNLRVIRNGATYAPLRYFDEPINMLNGRTLADVQQIFQRGLGKYYFKAGDFFDITFTARINLQNSGVIEDGSSWRVVCLGIDHNPDIEGYNRGHFCIGRNTDNIEICFYSKEHKSTNDNSGGWAVSKIRTFLNSTFYNALSPELQAVITPCDKYTDNVAGGTYDTENMSITSDKLWLMSFYEISGSTYNVNPAEANLLQRYDYYKNGNSVIRYHHTNLQEHKYTTRSPTTFKSYFKGRQVSYWGNPGAPTNVGFAPCFTIS